MSSHSRTVASVAALAVVAAGAVLLARGTRASADHRAADVNVSCAPSQRAVVRQTMTGATPLVEVLCVDGATATPTGYAIAGGGELVPAAYAPTAVAAPAVYYPQAVAPSVPAPFRPRVARTSTAGIVPVRRTAQRPSWQKRALVIGGSAGAGAGIGALIGGKKGALIGAAIGGGGATILDQVKQR